jgi:hypothetical protein
MYRYKFIIHTYTFLHLYKVSIIDYNLCTIMSDQLPQPPWVFN